jgi:hypothetical protein
VTGGGVLVDFTTVDAATYTINVQPVVQGVDTPITIALAAEVVQDALTVWNTASNVLTFVFDTVAPTTTLTLLASVYGSGVDSALTVTVGTITTLDTSNGAFEYTSVTVEGTLTATGSLPLILLSQGLVWVKSTGTISVAGMDGGDGTDDDTTGAGGGGGGGAYPTPNQPFTL